MVESQLFVIVQSQFFGQFESHFLLNFQSIFSWTKSGNYSISFKDQPISLDPTKHAARSYLYVFSFWKSSKINPIFNIYDIKLHPCFKILQPLVICYIAMKIALILDLPIENCDFPQLRKRVYQREDPIRSS